MNAKTSDSPGATVGVTKSDSMLLAYCGRPGAGTEADACPWMMTIATNAKASQPRLIVSEETPEKLYVFWRWRPSQTIKLMPAFRCP